MKEVPILTLSVSHFSAFGLNTEIQGKLPFTHFKPMFMFSSVLFSGLGGGKETIGMEWITLPTFTCSKSTIETLEKGLRYVQSQQ